MAKMKPGLLYSVIAVAAIVIVAGFHMQLGIMPEHDIPQSVADTTLYVCPAASSTWDSIALVFRPLLNYALAGVFFVVVLLAFGWGWTLYQNLLSDKFKRDDFKNIWIFTKWAFWGCVILLLLTATPNSFRRVNVDGRGDNWVLCNANTPGNLAVSADTVHTR